LCFIKKAVKAIRKYSLIKDPLSVDYDLKYDNITINIIILQEFSYLIQKNVLYVVYSPILSTQLEFHIILNLITYVTIRKV